LKEKKNFFYFPKNAAAQTEYDNKNNIFKKNTKIIKKFTILAKLIMCVCYKIILFSG